MKIKSVTIIKDSGLDKVFLNTNMPNSCYPFNGTLTLEFKAAHNAGYKYVKSNFNVDDKVITIIDRS